MYKEFGTLPQVRKGQGLLAVQKPWRGWDIGRGSAKACGAAGAVQEICAWEMLGGQSTDSLRGVAFWSVRSWRLLRWFCATGAALLMTWPHFFHARRSTLDTLTRKITKRIGTRSSALHWAFHFWSNSRRIASFCLMLTTSDFEEVSQTCFAFDFVKFKNWRSLAE